MYGIFRQWFVASIIFGIIGLIAVCYSAVDDAGDTIAAAASGEPMTDQTNRSFNDPAYQPLLLATQHELRLTIARTEQEYLDNPTQDPILQSARDIVVQSLRHNLHTIEFMLRHQPHEIDQAFEEALAQLGFVPAACQPEPAEYDQNQYLN